MSLIYRNVYTLMNDLLRATESVAILKKTRAFNEGYKSLTHRMVLKNQCPNGLLDTNDIATTISTNYASCPTGFLRWQSVWKKVGTAHRLVELEEILTLERLQLQTLDRFHLTTDTGAFRVMAFSDDKMYFDKHWESSDTDAIKLMSWNYPTEVEAYDKISITGPSADFTVGETITGTTSAATATVHTNAATYLYLTSESVSGTFQTAETITGTTSGSTATTSSAVTEKVQVLELGEKYKLALATAGAAMYLFMEGSIEAQEKDGVLDAIVAELALLVPVGYSQIRGSV